MLIDANLLIYAADALAPEHARVSTWLTEQLNGDRRVGIPWQSLTTFVRISTHPRATATPLRPADAWQFRVSGNLVPDAHLAALAIEHGLEVCSADTDFARFGEIRWRNPLTG